MGLVLMSERELQRIEVSAQVLDGSLRSATAASLLGLSQRQVQRLLGQVWDEGALPVRPMPCAWNSASGLRGSWPSADPGAAHGVADSVGDSVSPAGGVPLHQRRATL